jgi:capsule polysaccharide export protein KpsE/RkpR
MSTSMEYKQSGGAGAVFVEEPEPGPLNPIESLGSTPGQRALASVRLIGESRRLLFRIALISVIAGSALAFLLPRDYKSTLTLMPPENQSGASMAKFAALAGATGGGAATALAGDMLGVRTSGALYIGILQSRTISDQIVDKFDLRKVYGVRLKQRARRKLQDHTFASEDRKTGLISIVVTDHDPSRAAAIAQAYADGIDVLLRNLNTSSAHLERVFLEQRLKSIKTELDTAEQALAQFSSQNNTIDIKEQGKAMVTASSTVEGQLIAARTQLEGLRQIYSDDNVRAKEARARVAELENQLARLRGSGSESQIASTPEMNGAFPSLRKLPLLGVPYTDLYRRATIAETVYAALSQQYELAKVQEAKETPTLKVLDAPDIPERSSGPPRLTIILLSLLLSITGAIVWILGRARWREIDPRNGTKLLINEIFAQVHPRPTGK